MHLLAISGVPKTQRKPAFLAGWDEMSGLWFALAPAASSLALNVGTSVLVFPYFTYVQSSGLLGALLPQARPCLRPCYIAC